MNGICPTLNCFYGAIPADDCESSWIAVKVDRAGNRINLQEGFATEQEAETCAALHHQTDLEMFEQRQHASLLMEGVAVALLFACIFVWTAIYHTLEASDARPILHRPRNEGSRDLQRH